MVELIMRDDTIKYWVKKKSTLVRFYEPCFLAQSINTLGALMSVAAKRAIDMNRADCMVEEKEREREREEIEKRERERERERRGNK
jgi:hypothetical protein